MSLAGVTPDSAALPSRLHPLLKRFWARVVRRYVPESPEQWPISTHMLYNSARLWGEGGMVSHRTAVVLFQLGGPDTLEAIEPFLFNLFCDPDIIDFPGARIGRRPLAKLISA